MPVILATWEAEIWRIMVWGQPRQTVHETPPTLQNNQRKIDWSTYFASLKPWVQTPIPTKKRKKIFPH
jgi:hypothetical protein